MAENTENKSENKPEDRNTGTPDPSATASTDATLGAAVGLSEGQVKQVRHEAGLNQLAGNEANTLAWEASPAGKEFLKGNKDREKRYEEEAKASEKARSKDGLNKAEVKYKEVADKARKG